jgi:hypothetical protein
VRIAEIGCFIVHACFSSADEHPSLVMVNHRGDQQHRSPDIMFASCNRRQDDDRQWNKKDRFPDLNYRGYR